MMVLSLFVCVFVCWSLYFGFVVADVCHVLFDKVVKYIYKE